MSLEALTLEFMNAAADYLVVLDSDRRVVFANRAFRAKFLGGEEGTGRDFLTLLEAASVDRARETLAVVVESGGRQIELYHAVADGKLCPVHYSMGTMKIEGTTFTAAVGRNKTPDLELLGEITQLNIELEDKQKELSEAYARLEQMAVVDQLTGLYNRHYFFTVVGHFYEDARRSGRPLSCMMIDVDHFKSINDQYGHMSGDQVLKAVAGRLKANSRKSDLLARFGGEEFILVTPNTDIKTARFLAERTRSAIYREVINLGTQTITVSVSVGVSGTEVMAGTLEELIESADQALYSAKRDGRNRWVCYEPPPRSMKA